MSQTNQLGRGIYWTVGAYGAIVYAVLLIFPAITAELITKYGIDAEALGLLASVEMGALSLATVPAYLWLKRVNPKIVIASLSVVMALGNLYSAFASSFAQLCFARGVTGLAGGSIAVLMFAMARRSPDSGKCLGMFVTAQLVMAAVMLGIYPYVFDQIGVKGLYVTLAGLSLLALATVGAVPVDKLTPASAQASPVAGGGRTPMFAVVAGLTAITLFYICLSGVWAFIGLIAEESGISATTSNTILSIATAAGIASAALATFIGDTPRRANYVTLGLVLMGVSLLLLAGAPAALSYGIAALIFKFAWTFALPFLLGGLASLPGGDYVMNTTNLMLGVGSTAGPFLAGVVITRMGGVDAMLIAAGIGLVVSLVCARILEQGSRVAPLAAVPEEVA